MNENIKSVKTYSTFRVKLMSKKYKSSLPHENVLQTMSDNLFTKNSKIGHKILHSVTILHPEKRDGGIMNCIKVNDSQFITNQTDILKSCLNVLSEIQKRCQYNPIVPATSLESLSQTEVELLQSRMSKNKGLTGDGFSDNWFAKTIHINIINDLWKHDTFKLLPDIGEARLISLNKVWPNIPTSDQFRPITVLSPIFKWMELRFITKLNAYQTKYMKREQIGFVPSMSTLTNTRRLIHYIQSYRAADNKILIFIDFKCAFNTIIRSKLYDILKDKHILTPEEIDFIKCMHSHIHYKCGSDIYYYENGVPQGSLYSPALFNIYFEHFLNEIHSRFTETKVFAYADDVAFIINENDLNNFINTLTQLSGSYNLSINKNKSGIMWLRKRNHSINQTHINDFPVVFSYNYLGIVIENNGKINFYNHKIKNKVTYLSNRIKWASQHCTLRNKILLWKCYIRPYYLYMFPIFGFIPEIDNYKYDI